MYQIDKVPFSRFGSYFSLSVIEWGPLGRGLYLHVHADKTVAAFRIDPVHAGQTLSYNIETSPHSLKLITADGGVVEFVISGLETVRVRGQNVSLQLEMPAERWTWAYQISGAWAFNYSPYQVQLALDVLQGGLHVSAPWGKGKGFCYETKKAIATITPEETGCFEIAIDEFLTSWVAPERRDFSLCLEEVEQEYAQWMEGLPVVEPAYNEARDLAAYVNWSATVNPAGCITRPTMYMSKMGMCNVYNWDNVFNAMAHCTHRPQFAWDQLLVMADHQDPYGKPPSSMNRSATRTTISNSLIHGWGLRYMWDQNPALLTSKRMREAYDYFAGWTDWMCSHSTWAGGIIPYHHHGFDGGWDNSSIYDEGVPIVTPDMPAYLVLVMEVLADLAQGLGRREDVTAWKRRRDEMLNALIDQLWKGDHFVGIIQPTGKEVHCESLLICMPMVLGRRLPADIRAALLARIQDHLTPYGLATEKFDSPNYVEGGYWRGPIWAPSTMLITSGLLDIGEHDLARSIMRSFCDMCNEHGFYENFDPVTGKGYYDTAYTWTSSVFMLFANMLQ